MIWQIAFLLLAFGVTHNVLELLLRHGAVVNREWYRSAVPSFPIRRREGIVNVLFAMGVQVVCAPLSTVAVPVASVWYGFVAADTLQHGVQFVFAPRRRKSLLYFFASALAQAVFFTYLTDLPAFTPWFYVGAAPILLTWVRLSNRAGWVFRARARWGGR